MGCEEIKTITAICPAVGWEAVYEDEEGECAEPIACWAAVRKSNNSDRPEDGDFPTIVGMCGGYELGEAEDYQCRKPSFVCYRLISPPAR